MKKIHKITTYTLILIIAIIFPFASISFSPSCSDRPYTFGKATRTTDRYCGYWPDREIPVQLMQWGLPLPFIVDKNAIMTERIADMVDSSDEFLYVNYLGNVLIVFLLLSLIAYPLTKDRL